MPPLQLNSNIIKRENSLGTILDKHLTWKKHIQLIESKVSRNNGVLYKISKLNSKCLRNIYFSFIHSYINYVNITWASTNKTKLKKTIRGTKTKTKTTKTNLRMPVHYLRF